MMTRIVVVEEEEEDDDYDDPQRQQQQQVGRRIAMAFRPKAYLFQLKSVL